MLECGPVEGCFYSCPSAVHGDCVDDGLTVQGGRARWAMWEKHVEFWYAGDGDKLQCGGGRKGGSNG